MRRLKESVNTSLAALRTAQNTHVLPNYLSISPLDHRPEQATASIPPYCRVLLPTAKAPFKGRKPAYS